MTSATKNEFLEKFREGFGKSIKTKSNADLCLTVGVNIVRLGHLTHALLRQRSVMFVDSHRFTIRNNVAGIAGLALGSIGLYVAGNELAMRVKIGESPFDTASGEEIETSDLAAKAVGTGIEAIQAVNGRTLVGKRQLTLYGRAYKGFAVATTATRTALLLRAKMS